MAAQDADGSFDPQIDQRVRDSAKISLLSAGMVWLITPEVRATQHQVFAGEETPDVTWNPAIGTRAEWVSEQPATLASEKGKFESKRVLTRPDGLALYEGRDKVLRVFVPIQRRRALYEWHHAMIMHLAADKTYRSINENYYWPSCKADVRKWYAECSVCELSKATRNLAHGRFRAVRGSAPRSRWALDFYGVGDANVLGLIDLDSLWVELYYTETRDAESVRRAVCDRILHRHGTPRRIHSDHAKEFVGRVMSRLAKERGYRNTSTGGYSPTGNATIESFWSFLGLCLRNLSDEDYLEAEMHLQEMAWAWNTSHSNSLGVTPFEVMTGTKPRTVAGSAMMDDGADGAIDLDSIRKAAAEYRRLALSHADYMREERATYLNSRGRVLRELRVGDFVKIFMPAGHEEAVARQRKQKHIRPFRGPLEIIEKPSATTLELRCYFNPARTYMRHISNVRRWVGPLPPKEATSLGVPPPMTADVEVGDFLFYRDADGASTFYLVKVVAITDEAFTVHCWGSSSANAATAAYKPIYVGHSGAVFVGKPPNRVVSRPQAAIEFAAGSKFNELDDDETAVVKVHTVARIEKPRSRRASWLVYDTDDEEWDYNYAYDNRIAANGGGGAKRVEPWTWEFPIENDGLIAAQGIRLRKDSKFSADSKALLAGMAPAVIHRFV